MNGDGCISIACVVEVVLKLSSEIISTSREAHKSLITILNRPLPFPSQTEFLVWVCSTIWLWLRSHYLSICNGKLEYKQFDYFVDCLSLPMLLPHHTTILHLSWVYLFPLHYLLWFILSNNNHNDNNSKPSLVVHTWPPGYSRGSLKLTSYRHGQHSKTPSQNDANNNGIFWYDTDSWEVLKWSA